MSGTDRLKEYRVVGLFEDENRVVVDNVLVDSGFNAMVKAAYAHRDEDGQLPSDLLYMTLPSGEVEYASVTSTAAVYAQDSEQHFDEVMGEISSPSL